MSGKQNGAADSVPKPRGGQTGHKGVTNKPEPTRFEEHTPDTCPGCGLGKLSITKTIKQNITKVVRTITNITTCHSINTCRCNSCGREDIQAGDRSFKQRQLRSEHSDRGGRLLCVPHAVQNDRRLYDAAWSHTLLRHGVQHNAQAGSIFEYSHGRHCCHHTKGQDTAHR